MAASPIKILPDDLVNKIAAGEVVERPASVVKELIENSIDAGATQITAEIQDAGKKLIRVSDNGSGMTEEEIFLALQRHSTSKIKSSEDLFNIRTLGFRGEALPSIAGVSKMKIEANPSGAGICAEVKALFYNTPARKKFLKSNTTETGHIGEIIAKYTLAYPGTAFKFIADEKLLINSSGSGKLTDAVLAVYGAEVAKEVVEVEARFPFGRIFGLAGRPTLTRIDKNYETFFVNGRYVKNFLLNRALEEAYRTLIPGNRYPIAVLFIEIDPALVDVNVHPTKREVKFQKTQEVMDAVTSAVREALSKIVEAGSWHKGIETGEESGQGFLEAGSLDQLSMTGFQTSVYNPLPASAAPILEISAIQPLIPIYQLKNTYIVATDGEELVLIDQHAAHERVLYDRLSRESQVAHLQSLLIPLTIELAPSEAAVLMDNLDYVQGLGFEIEEFGGNSFILRAVPAVASKASVKQLIMDIIAELAGLGKSVQFEVKQEALRKLVACHSAIKAGDRLTQAEMNQLIRDLYTTQNPQTCPHGRPTQVRLPGSELAKRFGR